MIAGIIAEYNPFHLGHAYQIRQIKERLGADAVVVAMSGSFTQRGTPAIVSKYDRARMALTQGIDLVFEIPAVFSSSGAASYAMAGVLTLANTGIVDTLVFGCETDDMRLFAQSAAILNRETPEFSELLQDALAKGCSYAAARTAALSAAGIPEDFLYQPNNILGIEYVTAIRKLGLAMTPIALRRKGSHYHQTQLEDGYPSAAAIRSFVERSINKSGLSQAFAGLPDVSSDILSECLAKKTCIFPQDVSLPLHLRLLQEDAFHAYMECSEELSNRISNIKGTFCNTDAFCHALKTRNLTYAHISRVLCHILLGITKEDEALGKGLGYAPYLRLLGFSKNGASLLSGMKKQAIAPVITCLSDASKNLSADALSFLKKDIHAADIYRSILTAKSGRCFPTEYTRAFSLTNL